MSNLEEEILHQQIVGIVYRAQRAQQKKKGLETWKRAGRRVLRVATSGATLAAAIGVVFGAAFIDVVDDDLVVVRLGQGWRSQGSVAQEVRPTTLQSLQPTQAAAMRGI